MVLMSNSPGAPQPASPAGIAGRNVSYSLNASAAKTFGSRDAANPAMALPSDERLIVRKSQPLCNHSRPQRRYRCAINGHLFHESHPSHFRDSGHPVVFLHSPQGALAPSTPTHHATLIDIHRLAHRAMQRVLAMGFEPADRPPRPQTLYSAHDDVDCELTHGERTTVATTAPVTPVRHDAVILRRRWNDTHSGEVALTNVRDPRLRDDPGGVCSATSRPFLFVRLWCDQLTANHGLHTCDAATAPHELELCMLASDNDATIYTDLVRQARR